MDRANYTHKSFFPREGAEYTLADTMEMLYTDSIVRETMDAGDEVELERELAAMDMGETKKFMSGETLRMILKKTGPNTFQIHAVFGVVPKNDRISCSAPSAQDETMGRGFMGLGGNSQVGRMF